MRQSIAIVLGLLFLGIFCFFANLYISFGYGSLGGLISDWKQPPSEKTLSTLRAETKTQLTSIQDGLAAIPGLTLYERTYSDMCTKGEHGWKRSDSFAYTCAYRLTYYYGTNRDYKELLLDLEKKLETSGWEISGRTSSTPTIADILNKPSDELYQVELPDFVQRPSYSFQDGYITLAINSFAGYGVPWTKSNDEPSPFGFGLAIGQTYFEDTSDGRPETIARRILDSGLQPVMFAISKAYFTN
jgi:hypothetical protein